MRFIFHRLPPFLRVVDILGLLFLVAAFVLLVAGWPTFTQNPPNATHIIGIALNLIILGQACFIVINTYTERFCYPDSGPLRLDSWQSQALAIALMGAMSLCAITLTAVIPSTTDAFQVVRTITLIGAAVVLLTFLLSAID